MGNKVIAIITAGGSGRRFSKLSNSNLPKQFLKLNNTPLILFPLMAMQKCRAISGIFITSPAEYFDKLHEIAYKNKISKLAALVEGGKTRFESVRNAVYRIDASANDLVLIHDAVRPNLDVSFLNKILQEARKYKEIIIGSRVSETVKREKKGFISETINRENLWTIQTPQVFRYKVLMDSYNKTRKINYTDESSLVEEAGYKVKIMEGPPDNIKVTTPHDLKILKKIMK